MKIIIATPLYPPETEKLAVYSKELARQLCGNHNVIIAAYATTAEKIQGVKLLTVNKHHPLPTRLLKYTAMLFRASRQANVIFAQNAVAAGLPAIIIQRLRGIPVILNFAEDEAWKNAKRLGLTEKKLADFLLSPEGGFKIRLFLILQKFVLHRAHAVIVSSSLLAKIITRAYVLSPKKIIINYNPPEKTQILPFPDQPTSHQIITIARLVEWNGIAALIRATSLLKKEFADVRLLIIGDGPQEKKLKMLARELGLDNNVRFLGNISRAESWYLQKNSQALLFNSTDECLVDSLLVGLTANIPVVATNSPITEELITDNESGFLVKGGSPEKFAEIITHLFQKSLLRQQITQAAQKTLQEKFSWDAHLHVLCNTFKSIFLKTNRNHG